MSNSDFNKKITKYSLFSGLFFVSTAIIGVLVGSMIDNSLGIKPWGSLAIITLMYVLTCIGIFVYYKKVSKKK